jgi:hypothetical protein
MQTANEIFLTGLIWFLVIPALCGVGINAGRKAIRARRRKAARESGDE